MEPRFNSGDVIVVEPNTKPREKDFCFYRLVDGRRGFRQLFIEDDGRIRLQPTNLDFPPLIVHPGEVDRLSRVVRRMEDL